MAVQRYRDPGTGQWVPASFGTPEDLDAKYVNVPGDTMSGRLTINEAPVGADTSNAGVRIIRTTYPQIDLIKTSSLPGTASDWRVYISGAADAVDPALSFIARDKDTGAVLTTYRMQQTGTLVLGANPVNALDAATKGYADSLAELPDTWRGGCGVTTIPTATAVYPTAWNEFGSRGITRSSDYFTLSKAGVYALGFSGLFSANVPVNQRAFLEFEMPTRWVRGAMSEGPETMLAVASVYGFTAGENFRCRIYHTAGSTLTFTGVMNVVRLGDL